MKDALLRLARDVGGPILGLDTSTPEASLALVAPQSSLMIERQLSASSRPSDSIVVGIEELLARGRLAPKDLKAIVVGLGPGSFTGLRVGLSTAKGLALGGDVPLYGVSSMEILARDAPPGIVAVVGDARRGDLYAALYERTADGQCHALLAEQVQSLAAFTRAVSHVVGDNSGRTLESTIVTGDASRAVAEAWGAKHHAASVRIAHGIVSAQNRLLGHKASDLDSLVPHYLRTSSVGR